MTGRCHEAAARAARLGVLPLLPAERLLASERTAAALAARAFRPPTTVAGAIDPRDVRAGWGDGDLIGRALAEGRRSLDRAIVETYLRDYPVRHPGFATLAAAAATAAERHDWHWREAGRHWRLWDGPDALRAAPSRAAGLRAAGLVGGLATGAFARAVRRR